MASKPIAFNPEKLMRIVSSGLFLQFGDDLMAGVLAEVATKLETKDVLGWIKEDKNLWDEIPLYYQMHLTNFAPKFGKLEWFTVDWVINSIRESKPALASLLINWPESRDWLDRQIKDIKSHLGIIVPE